MPFWGLSETNGGKPSGFKRGTAGGGEVQEVEHKPAHKPFLRLDGHRAGGSTVPSAHMGHMDPSAAFRVTQEISFYTWSGKAGSPG